MTDPERTKTNRSPAKHESYNTEQADAAALIDYLAPSIHLLEQLDYMSSKLVALVISDLCETHGLEVPDLVNRISSGDSR